jgi:hypothetical protein
MGYIPPLKGYYDYAESYTLKDMVYDPTEWGTYIH